MRCKDVISDWIYIIIEYSRTSYIGAVRLQWLSTGLFFETVRLLRLFGVCACGMDAFISVVDSAASVSTGSFDGDAWSADHSDFLADDQSGGSICGIVFPPFINGFIYETDFEGGREIAADSRNE